MGLMLDYTKVQMAREAFRMLDAVGPVRCARRSAPRRTERTSTNLRRPHRPMHLGSVFAARCLYACRPRLMNECIPYQCLGRSPGEVAFPQQPARGTRP